MDRTPAEEENKMTKRKPLIKQGDTVFIETFVNERGQHFWLAKRDDKYLASGGPFATKAAAKQNSETTVLGTMPVIEGGQWDPNWEKPQ